MSTSQSPDHILRAQAHRIADSLKRAERGEKVANDPAGRIAASRAKGVIDFAIVMDDKIVKIEVPWATIEALTMPLLCDFIYDQMKGEGAKGKPN
jgi:hypothetical protein